MSQAKKVLYTVITNRYDHLFPPLGEYPDWDLICFTDDGQLAAEGWQVRPLPDLPELAQVQNDPVRKARLVKLLAHRFLPEYDASVFVNGGRVLLGDVDAWLGQHALVCLRDAAADPYAAVQQLLEREDEDAPPLRLADAPLMPAAEREKLLGQVKRWKKEGVPDYCGCPGTAILGRRHHQPQVAAAMEAVAKEVLEGSAYDEPAFGAVCWRLGLEPVRRLSQAPAPGCLFSQAEQLAMQMQHVRLADEAQALEEESFPPNPPPPGGKYDGYPLVLTIGVPVSNQIGTIRRCLEGIKPILDGLPAELVVVDTGSTDGTIEVCREYGARVVQFPWIGDMSAARNNAIRAARGCWYMSIDDDEWFEDVSLLISFFKDGTYKTCAGARYNQRNYSDRNMHNYQDNPTFRMAKMTPDLHFEGKIHDNLISDAKGRIAYIPVAANHLGFAFDSVEKVMAKVTRNMAILRKEIVNDTKNLRFAYQSVKEYGGAEQFADAIRMAHWVMSLARGRAENSSAYYWNLVCRGFAMTNYLHGGPDGEETNGTEALAFYRRFIQLEHYNYLDRCMLTFSYLRACMLQVAADPACLGEGVQAARQYAENRKQYLGLQPADQEMQWRVMGRDGVSPAVACGVAEMRLVCLRLAGKYDDGLAWVRSKQAVACFCEEDALDYRAAVLDFLCQQQQWELIATLLKKFKEANDGMGMEYLHATLYEQARDEDVPALEKAVQAAEGKAAAVLPLLALRRQQPGAKAAAGLYKKSLAYAQNALFVPGQYFRSRLLYEAFRLGLPPGGVLAVMDRGDMERVKEDIREKTGWRAELKQQLLAWWLAVGEDAPEMERYLAFYMSYVDFRDKELDREMEPQAYLDAYLVYVQRRYAWEVQQAAPGLLEGEGAPGLPDELRAVCAARGALVAYEAGQYTEALRLLKAVVVRDPSCKHAVALMNETVMAETEAEMKRMSEFEALLESLKPRLRQLLAAGHIGEVKAMLAQIESIAPDDAEIVAMRRQVGMDPVS